MKGLEATEILHSDIKLNNSTYRIDSVYFKKEYTNIVSKLKRNNSDSLINCATLITDFGAYSQMNIVEFIESGVLFLRNKDVKENCISKEDNVYISSEVYDSLTLKLEENDIIIPRVGTLGNAAVIKKELLPCSANQNLAQIKINTEEFSPYYISTFLSSKYGYSQIIREATGNVQPWLNLDAIGRLLVYKASSRFQLDIETVVLLSHRTLEKSYDLYSQAEQILLNELGANDFDTRHESNQVVTSVKRLSESFEVSGRIDAEYYQPKYDEIEKIIKLYSGGHDTFGNLIEYIFTGEYSDEYLMSAKGLNFYIRSTNIKSGLIDIDSEHYVEPSKFSKCVKTGDIVTARVGTIGVFGEIEESLNASIASDNVLCFRFPEHFMPDVYTLYLNSIVNHELVNRLARGSVQQRLNQETLKDILIPIFDNLIQDKVSKRIQESFALRKQSKELLEAAKTAVEIAIEQNEEAAMKYLEKQI